MTSSPEKKRSKTTDADLESFEALFSVLNDDLTKSGMKDDEISVAMKYFKRVCCLFLFLTSYIGYYIHEI